MDGKKEESSKKLNMEGRKEECKEGRKKYWMEETKEGRMD